jgi:hypothetical protein
MTQKQKIKVLSPLHKAAKKLLDAQWAEVKSIPDVAVARDLEWGKAHLKWR